MHCLRSTLFYLRQPRAVIVAPQRILVNMQKNVFSFKKYSISVNTEESDSTDQIIGTICKDDMELEKKLKILMLEVEVMRQDGRLAPEKLNIDQWRHLTTLKSRNQRSSFLTFLFKTEKAKENEKARREAKRKEYDENPIEIIKEYPDDLVYGISQQSLFLRIRDKSINSFDNYKALQAIMHGQSVVLDCSYDEYMVFRESVNAAKQVTYIFGDNRIHKNPFNLHLCNVNLDGTFMRQLRKNIPMLDEPWFPMNITSDSYMDIFPKDKLVYLTPHCRNELTHFDHEAVYIVGCMVDKINNEPLSLAKAKRDGIKMAKLPLDRYLEWAPGSKKNLNMNHMVPILLDLKATGDWDFSLKHIPRRKLMETKILGMMNKLKRSPTQYDPFKDFKMPNAKVLDLKQKRNSTRRSLFDDENI